MKTASHSLPVKAAALGCLVLLLVGCGEPAFRGAASGRFPLVERAERPEAITDFSKLFNAHCQGCHGAAGRDGPAPPLNDPLFLAIVPGDVVRQVIVGGRNHTLMPAFSKTNGGPLTDEQVRILAEGLSTTWGMDDGAKDAPAYLLADAVKKGGSQGNAGNGAGTFAMSCATCHGENGKGGTAGAVNDAAFLDLVSDQELRRIVITGRHDLGMPDFRTRADKNFKPLTNQDVADVVALLAQWRKSGVAATAERGGKAKSRE